MQMKNETRKLRRSTQRKEEAKDHVESDSVAKQAPAP